MKLNEYALKTIISLLNHVHIHVDQVKSGEQWDDDDPSEWYAFGREDANLDHPSDEADFMIFYDPNKKIWELQIVTTTPGNYLEPPFSEWVTATSGSNLVEILEEFIKSAFSEILNDHLMSLKTTI